MWLSQFPSPSVNDEDFCKSVLYRLGFQKRYDKREELDQITLASCRIFVSEADLKKKKKKADLCGSSFLFANYETNFLSTASVLFSTSVCVVIQVYLQVYLVH